MPLPVNHTISTLGFQITSKDDKDLFITGDTGPGLSALWEYISPQLIIMDLTFPNSLEYRAINSSHLCPRTFKNELLNFYNVKNYYPQIYLYHMSPQYENEIRNEVNEISSELDLKINIAEEGDKIKI